MVRPGRHGARFPQRSRPRPPGMERNDTTRCSLRAWRPGHAPSPVAANVAAYGAVNRAFTDGRRD